MLKPSYAELMDIMNRDNELGKDVTSRYSVVIAAAKRARQIIDGDTTMAERIKDDIKDKPLSLAIEELNEGKVKVVPEGMGTELHLKKEESFEEEIKQELEQAALENEAEDEALYAEEEGPSDEELDAIEQEEIDDFEENGIEE